MCKLTSAKHFFSLHIIFLLFFFSLSSEVDAGWFKKLKKVFVRSAVPSSLTKVEKKLVRGGKTVNIGGIKVVQVDRKIDIKKKDAKGRTNCDRMRNGFAPLGSDNIELELHHSQQSNTGPILELTNTEHKQNNKTLHDKKTNSMIDRKLFDKWRRSYWMRRSLQLCRF